MDLCKKTTQLLLNLASSKTIKLDNELLNMINSKLSSLREQSKSLLAEQDSFTMQLNFLKDQLDIAKDPTSHIESKLFELLNLNEPETFEPLMLQFLKTFKQSCQSQTNKKYIQQFIHTFPKALIENSVNDIKAIDTTYALDDGIDELLYILAKQKSNQAKCEALFEHYSTQLDHLNNEPEFKPEKRQDKIAIKSLTKSLQQRSIKLKHSQEKLLALYHEVTKFKCKQKISFDIDPSFNLTGLLQSTKNQTTEILFVNNKSKTSSIPYQIYENGPIHFICAGSFGTVKVGQNLQDKTLHAIIIQKDVLTSRLTMTDLELTAQKPFSNNLNYLLSGVDLDEHIEKRRQPSIENRLNIARQAALILDKVSKQRLQIQPEITSMNFIWDDINKQLYFCYLAPSLSTDRKNVEHPMLITTLGKLCQALFEAVPQLPPVVQTLIDDLLDGDKAKSLDLQQVAHQLDDLFISPSTYLKNEN